MIATASMAAAWVLAQRAIWFWTLETLNVSPVQTRPSDPLQTVGQVVSATWPGARSRRGAGWR